MSKTKMELHLDGFNLTSIICKHPSGKGWLKVADCGVGDFPIGEQIDNAQLFVKTWNKHKELVAALKLARIKFCCLRLDGTATKYDLEALDIIERALMGS